MTPPPSGVNDVERKDDRMVWSVIILGNMILLAGLLVFLIFLPTILMYVAVIVTGLIGGVP